MDITETTFEAKRYLVLKKSIAISEITNKQMYDEAGAKLGAYIVEHMLTIAGPWSVMYFTWDQDAGHTDIGIAFPVSDLEAVEDAELSIVDVPTASAALAVMHGPYEGLSAAHGALMTYTRGKSYSKGDLPIMAIEEYAVGPMENPDPSSWITNIYYFHQ